MVLCEWSHGGASDTALEGNNRPNSLVGFGDVEGTE
jgi:hypothetical protein